MSPLLFETLTLKIAHSVDAAKMNCLSSHQNTPLIKKVLGIIILKNLQTDLKCIIGFIRSVKQNVFFVSHLTNRCH